MEESSNGKIEETQQADLEEQDDKVVSNHVEEPKPQFESVREIAIDESPNPNSDIRNAAEPEEEGEAKEESSPIKDLGVFEKEETENINPIVALPQEEVSAVEPSVEKSINSEVTEVEPKGIAPVLADGVLNGTKETTLLPSTWDEPDGAVFEVVSSTTQDGFCASAADNMSKGIEEKLLQSVDENLAASDVETKGIDDIKGVAQEKTGEPSGIAVKEFVETFDDSSKPSTDATIVGSNDASPETVGTPHVISISSRSVRPTSWRSCCGLFEVLRRSDR